MEIWRISIGVNITFWKWWISIGVNITTLVICLKGDIYWCKHYYVGYFFEGGRCYIYKCYVVLYLQLVVLF